jgi:hypothetical protein
MTGETNNGEIESHCQPRSYVDTDLKEGFAKSCFAKSPPPVAFTRRSDYLVFSTVDYSGKMMDQTIIVPSLRLQMRDLDQFKENPFEKMIKFVVDVHQRRIALGGEMHSDAEEILLRSGSRQADIWGGNLWPWEQPARIEYISLINIRPSFDNRGMEIQSSELREQVRDIVHLWVELP